MVDQKKTWSVPVSLKVLLAFTSGMFSAYVLLNRNKKQLGRDEQKAQKTQRRGPAFNRKETQTYCTTMSPEQVMDLIVSRRTYKPDLYTGEKVPVEHIRKILEAANWGMSHVNSQPWRFVVFSNVDVLLERTREHFRQYQKTIFPWEGYTSLDNFFQAFEKKCLKRWSKCSHIVGIGMKRKTLERRTNPLWEEQCAVATSIQNASLMATSLKIACQWSSWYEPFTSSPECVEFLGLDPKAGDRCMGVFTIGLSDKFGKSKAKRDGFDAKVTWSSF